MASQPKVKTPRAAVLVGSTGGTAALLAAAAVSFQGLAGLGALVGIANPWLLPIAIDIYAATSTLVALLLPPAHPARSTAVWNARLGLAMSMAGNAADRAMHLGSYSPADGFLTFVGAWPSLIVERLLHLQGRLATDATATENATALPSHASRRDNATRPVVAPMPSIPVARPETSATKPVAPNVAPATVTVAPRDSAPTPATPVAVNDVVLSLIKKHGLENVTGPMVGEALGKHRGTGARHLDRVKKALETGKLTLPPGREPRTPADDPDRVPVGVR